MSAKRPGETDEVGAVYVVLSRSEQRGEGIAGVQTVEGWTPLVFSTRASLDRLIELGRCQTIADVSGESVSVVRFTRAEVVAEFQPGDKGDVSRIPGETADDA